MLLLAFNTVLPQSMRMKYQFGIGVLPISLMFASLFPLWQLAVWLETHFPIPANSSIKDLPHGGVFIAFLLSALALIIFGYAMGWVINAVIARYVLGWSADKMRAVFLHSKVPDHWLKELVGNSSSVDAQSIAKWEVQRKVGAFRFTAVRGVLAWGGPMLLAMYVMPTYLKGQGFSLETTFFSIALWACAGASFGAAIWYSSEASYRKLKQRNET